MTEYPGVNMKGLAQAVAAALGAPWAFTEADEHEPPRCLWARIARPDGAEISVHLNTYPKPRLNISGVYPRGPNGRDYGPWDSTKRPSMGVAPDRPAAVIAKEIARRLLPEYLPLYAKAVQDKAAYDAGAGVQQGVASRLAFTLGLPPRAHPADSQSVQIHVYQTDGCYGEFTVSNGGGVQVKLTGLTPAQADAVARVVAKKGE